AQFLDPPPEGPLAALGAAVEGHVEAQQVIAGEDVADQRSRTGELPGVGAKPVEGGSQGGCSGCVEAQPPSRRRPDAGAGNRSVRGGRVVPDRDAPRSCRIVLDADEVEALGSPGASTASQVDAGLGGGAKGGFGEPLPGAKI